MQIPDDLDAAGTQLWTTYIDLRHHEREAKAAYRAARQALRSQSLTATPAERATVDRRYREAVERRDELVAARQAAERAYRAYRRGMAVRHNMTRRHLPAHDVAGGQTRGTLTRHQL